MDICGLCGKPHAMGCANLFERTVHNGLVNQVAELKAENAKLRAEHAEMLERSKRHSDERDHYRAECLNLRDEVDSLKRCVASEERNVEAVYLQKRALELQIDEVRGYVVDWEAKRYSGEEMAWRLFRYLFPEGIDPSPSQKRNYDDPNSPGVENYNDLGAETDKD